MGDTDVVELRESILDLLMSRFAGQLLDPDLVAEANELVRDRFLQIARVGAPAITFGDGGILTGYDVSIDHERSSFGLTPQTEFSPSHRYRPVGTTSESRIALGMCGRFDLWVVRDGPRPPTIIARYGDGDGDYLSANPADLGLTLIRQIGEPFPEALERLVRLGLLVDDGSLDAFDPDGRSPRAIRANSAKPPPSRAAFTWLSMFARRPRRR